MEQEDAERYGLPDDWEPWQSDAVVDRAYGKSYSAIARECGKMRKTVTRFLATAPAMRVILSIRREASAVAYGRAITMMPKALDVLDELLDTGTPTVKLSAVDLVRRLVGDAVKSDSAAAIRELTRKLKEMKAGR